MPKVKVPVLGTIGKSVAIEADAPSRVEMRAAIAAALAAVVATGGAPAQTAYPTIWRLIREIPANVTAIAELASTGIVVRTGPGAMTTRSVAVTDTGRLTITNGSGVAGNPTLDMADVSARSLWANATNASAKPAALQSSGDKAVPHQDGTTLAFSAIDHTYVSDFDEAAQDAVGSILTDSARIDFTYTDSGPSITADIIANSIGNSQLRQGVGTSVIGRSAGTTGNVADIAAGSDDTLFRRVAGALDFGQLTVGMFPNDVVTYAKIQNVSTTSRILGRITAGAGDIEELTGTQATSLLDVFTSTLKGLVPASGGSSTQYLSADGTFSTPATGGTGANPTASVGLTAVNGVATTFLRSDGAPALDQGISPTWTASHTWALGQAIQWKDIGGTTRTVLSQSNTGGADRLLLNVNGTSPNFLLQVAAATALSASASAIVFGNATNNQTFTFAGSGLVTATGTLMAAAASANILLQNSGAALNQKNSLFRNNGTGIVILSSATDAAPTTAVTNAFQFTRSGAAWTDLAFGNTTDNPTFTHLGTGQVLFPDGSGAVPGLGFSGDPDTGVLRAAANSITFLTGGTTTLELLDSSSLGIPLRIGALGAAPSNQTAAYVGVSTSAFTGNNGDLVLAARSSAAGVIRFYSGSGGAVTEKVRIENAGQLALSNGSAGTPAAAAISDPNTGIFFSGADSLLVSTGGTSRMQVGLALIQTFLPIRVEAAASNGTASTLVIGNGTASTATAGGVASLPATVAGYLVWIVNNVTVKVPYYAN
jgi:hypothetical protein